MIPLMHHTLNLPNYRLLSSAGTTLHRNLCWHAMASAPLEKLDLVVDICTCTCLVEAAPRNRICWHPLAHEHAHERARAHAHECTHARALAHTHTHTNAHT